MVDQATVVRLFDATWYLNTYPEAADQEPWEHFRHFGAAGGFDPNPMFSTSWYLRRYPDVADSGLNALEDYVSRGVAAPRDPGPLFSTRWYLTNNPDVAAAGVNPLEHYLSYGSRELRDPSPVFHTAWYFASYPNAAAVGVDARVHYLEHGAFIGYSPCPLFDSQWYLDTYPEVAAEGINPLLHYLTEGAARGFDPSPRFSTLGYFDSHPEAVTSDENPLVHFLINASVQDRASISAAVSLPSPMSRAVIADVQELIEAMSPIEPDLAAISESLDKLPANTFSPDRCTSTWRRLYLSIYELPRRLVLVGSIDQSPELARLMDDASGLLIVETDTQRASTAELLALGTEWRSLSEFGFDLDSDDRVKLAATLVNSLQPTDLLVWGSRAGWEMLAEYGAALRSNTALFAAVASSPQFSATDLLRKYFRPCIPVISALYGPDEQQLQRISSLFGLPPGEHWRLRHLTSCKESDGFLAPLDALQ
jgi:hypothetical protein